MERPPKRDLLTPLVLEFGYTTDYQDDHPAKSGIGFEFFNRKVQVRLEDRYWIGPHMEISSTVASLPKDLLLHLDAKTDSDGVYQQHGLATLKNIDALTTSVVSAGPFDSLERVVAAALLADLLREWGETMVNGWGLGWAADSRERSTRACEALVDEGNRLFAEIWSTLLADAASRGVAISSGMR